jgi:hypothetical protein
LLIGGGINFAQSTDTVQVLGGYVKIGNAASVHVLDTDPSGASGNAQIVAPGAVWDSTPAIRLQTQHSATSVTDPVPATTFDFAAAFTSFRIAADALAPCPSTVQLQSRDDQ